MMYNLAYFMLPPRRSPVPLSRDQPVPHLPGDRGHGIAQVLLRLLALAATVQFVSSAASVLLSTVAWQAAGTPTCCCPAGWDGTRRGPRGGALPWPWRR